MKRKEVRGKKKRDDKDKDLERYVPFSIVPSFASVRGLAGTLW